MKRRQFALGALSPLALAACGGGSDDPIAIAPAPAPAPAPATAQATAAEALKRAVTYMDEVVSFKGGYVWSYSPDLTQTFGEMQAKRTMVWIQPPGTPSMGHIFLDAYHATGDERFYQAAERTALAIVDAQRPEGGWNYIHDFAGEESLKHWYDTVGKNGWRLEEFQAYLGNSTFDDAGTAVSAQLMLRMWLEKKDTRFQGPLNKVIDFIKAAQFGPEFGKAAGGWPQRFPAFPNGNALKAKDSMWGSTNGVRNPAPNQQAAINAGIITQDTVNRGMNMQDGDYTLHVTFNDDVMGENIKFLTMCVISLGRRDLIPTIRAAMDCMQRMQWTSTVNPMQSGWSLQHLSRPTVVPRLDGNGTETRQTGEPAGARSYEPRSLATHTTDTNIKQLFGYFTLTGDKTYLRDLQKAITWLNTDAVKLSATVKAENSLIASRSHATFIELDTNEPLYVHRYGSNIHNGAYYFDKNHLNTVSHYSAGRNVDPAALQKRLNELTAMTDAQIDAMVAKSPLSIKEGETRPLPKYFAAHREVDFPDLFAGAVMANPTVTEAEVKTIIDQLGTKNYWTTGVPESVNEYRGDGPTAAYTGTAYRSKHVGDIYDTSPYPKDSPPDIAPYVKVAKPQFITTLDTVGRMGKLISFIAPVK